MSDDIDHLHEAKAHVSATPYTSEHHFQRAQAHALIAIAEELKRRRPNQVHVNAMDGYTPDQQAQLRDALRGEPK